jgi:hypothetical protein
VNPIADSAILLPQLGLPFEALRVDEFTPGALSLVAEVRRTRKNGDTP